MNLLEEIYWKYKLIDIKGVDDKEFKIIIQYTKESYTGLIKEQNEKKISLNASDYLHNQLKSKLSDKWEILINKDETSDELNCDEKYVKFIFRDFLFFNKKKPIE